MLVQVVVLIVVSSISSSKIVVILFFCKLVVPSIGNSFSVPGSMKQKLLFIIAFLKTVGVMLISIIEFLRFFRMSYAFLRQFRIL